MKWLVEFVKKIRAFLGDVQVELKKSTWPDRQELVESTVVVVISVVLLSIFVGVSDTILGSLVSLMVK
jgi:preprotein translocase subunit SecE